MDSNQYAIELVTYLLVIITYFYELIVYMILERNAIDSIAFFLSVENRITTRKKIVEKLFFSIFIFLKNPFICELFASFKIR